MNILKIKDKDIIRKASYGAWDKPTLLIPPAVGLIPTRATMCGALPPS
jgi:hypothetical protein